MILSFKTLAHKYLPVKEDAEDVLQDLTVRLLEMGSQFEQMPEIEKRKYIVVSIIHRCIDRTRRKSSRSRPRYTTELNESMAITKPDALSKIELKEVLQKGEGKMICETLFMFVDGYTCREIGEYFGISINTILGRCRYARKFLRA